MHPSFALQQLDWAASIGDTAEPAVLNGDSSDKKLINGNKKINKRLNSNE
jgi:hypothetical protein